MSNSITTGGLSPNPFLRDADGLLPNVTYIRKPDGSIDWRRMIEPDCIVPNRERTAETDITKLEDKELLILLRGFKLLAKLRGYLEIRTHIVPASPEFISAETHITWLPNFETGGFTFTTPGAADAHPNNTSGFGANFLTTIAENRSFVRCVRNFLDVPILGQDELGAAGNAEPSQSDLGEAKMLDELLKNNSIKFESFKNKMVKLGFDDASTWENTESVPKSRIFEIIEIVKTELAKKRAAAEAAKQS